MGLFDKEFCDICGEKVNKLTQKKVADGRLCSDCKHKLGAFTSGWSNRSIADVKKHFELKEQNKAKFQQFSCSASAGGRNNSIQVDFNRGWFIFATDNNKDYKSGNPQVFEFSQLQDFWLEQDFRTLSDSDHDGIPDSRDRFDNNQMAGNASGFGGAIMNGLVNGMMGGMQNSMLNVPLAAQPFVRNTNASSYSSSGVREISAIRACFKVVDPYITEPVSFTVNYISSGNQMELMQAYEIGVQIMTLCQQMKGGAAQQPMQGGYQQPMQGGFQQPMQNGYQQPMQGGYQQPMQNGYQQPMQNGYQQPAQNGYQQPMQNATWFCQSCGSQNTGAFCVNCGAPKQ